MPQWTQEDLKTFGDPDEIRIATMRCDGTLRNPFIVWIVRHGDDLYIRSVNGRDTAWFRGAITRHEGRITTGNAEKDIAFAEETDPGINDGVDEAYNAKYHRYPSIVPSMVTANVRSTTLRLVRR